MILGTYEIQDYTVTIDGVDETRQKIIYYTGEDVVVERYKGDPDSIKEGYTMTDGTPRRVLRWQFKSQLALEPSPDSGYTNLNEYTTFLISELTGATKIIATEAWNSANHISYYSPVVSYIANMAGLSDSDVRRIFRDSVNIQI
jgi:hypothetical protein